MRLNGASFSTRWLLNGAPLAAGIVKGWAWIGRSLALLLVVLAGLIGGNDGTLGDYNNNSTQDAQAMDERYLVRARGLAGGKPLDAPLTRGFAEMLWLEAVAEGEQVRASRYISNPVPSVAVGYGGVPGLRRLAPATVALICQSRYSWPCDEALRVVACESDTNWSAYNNGNYGGFQVNQVHVDKLERVTGSRDLDLLLVPWVNIAVAHIIWLDSGWAAWACRP